MLQVSFRARADKQFARLAKELQQKIYDELKRLSQDGLLHPKVRQIAGTKSGYRLRVGRWRIFFVLFRKEKRAEIVDIFLKKGRDDYQRRTHLLKHQRSD